MIWTEWQNQLRLSTSWLLGRSGRVFLVRESWWGGSLRVSYHKIPYEVQVSFILRCLKFPLFWGWDTRPWLHSERDLARAWHLLTRLSNSLGAAVALFCSMHTKERLGGCVALSTMLPEKDFPDPSNIVNKGQCVCVSVCRLSQPSWSILQTFPTSKPTESLTTSYPCPTEYRRAKFWNSSSPITR